MCDLSTEIIQHLPLNFILLPLEDFSLAAQCTRGDEKGSHWIQRIHVQQMPFEAFHWLRDLV